jgi:predicted AAA+ superfamily ATPase
MDQNTYLHIVRHYLSLSPNRNLDNANDVKESNVNKIDVETANKTLPDNIRAAALRWASERGGRSGRVAYQFSRYWIGQTQLAAEDNNS